MKSILTILLASFTTIYVNAQQNLNIAIHPAINASTGKVNTLFTDQTVFSTTNNSFYGNLKKGMTITPNSATKDVKVIFRTDKSAEAKIIVLDESGKNVLQQDAQIAEGNNNINIDNFHSLNDGTYTIQLISNNKTYTSTFMIWK